MKRSEHKELLRRIRLYARLVYLRDFLNQRAILKRAAKPNTT